MEAGVTVDVEMRLRSVEARLSWLRWFLAVQSFVLLAVIITDVHFGRSLYTDGTLIKAPVHVIGRDGAEVMSIEEYPKEAPLHLQVSSVPTSVSGACLTLGNGNGDPGIQLVSGESAAGGSVRTVRVLTKAGQTAVAADVTPDSSTFSVEAGNHGSSAVVLSTQSDEAMLESYMRPGGGASLRSRKDGQQLTLHDQYGRRHVQLMGGEFGGWLGVFPGPGSKGAPWSSLTSSELSMHPDSSEHVTARVSTSKALGRFELFDASGKSVYSAPSR